MKSVRILAAAAVVSALSFAPMPAHAQTVDLSKTSCKDFLASGKDGIVIVWAWLYGYYADEDAEPIVDFQALTSQGQKLAEACKAAPDKDIISAAKPIYEKKKK
jgi:acid stress chaperone HdeB